MNKEEYDHVVSLGYNCDIANALLHCAARDASYPFDWTFSNMSTIIHMFQNRFLNFFRKEEFGVARYKGTPAMQYKGGIVYVHDGQFDYLMRDLSFYTKQKEKYDRRTARLIELLDTGKRILFIRYAYDDTIQQHIQFIRMLETVYEKSVFTLLVMNMKHDENQESKIQYSNEVLQDRYEIGSYIRKKYNIPFYENQRKDYTE